MAAPSLSCGLQDLPSLLRHEGHLVVACRITVGISLPAQGPNLGRLLLELGVLAAGPSEKSLKLVMLMTGSDAIVLVYDVIHLLSFGEFHLYAVFNTPAVKTFMRTSHWRQPGLESSF